MTKAELITHLAGTADISKRQAELVLKELATFARDALAEGNDVALPDIGKLKVSLRAARTSRNPKTGETIEVPAKNTVKFVAAKIIKEAVL